MSRNLLDIDLPIEPLPLYRRDPETSSTLSSAPSYVSEAPTYYSQRPQPASERTSEDNIRLPSNSGNHASNSNAIPTPLVPHVEESTPSTFQRPPAPRYAPGFAPRPEGPQAHFDMRSYQVGNFNTFNANRQLHAVATRRAKQAAKQAGYKRSATSLPTAGPSSQPTRLPRTVTAPHPPPLAPRSPSPIHLTSPASSSSLLPATAANTHNTASPHEDPDLVGEAAASRARASRQYREACVGPSSARTVMATAAQYRALAGASAAGASAAGASAREQGGDFGAENKAWDFLVGQMSDWGERERGWSRFRERVVRIGTERRRGVGGGEAGGSGRASGVGGTAGSRAVVSSSSMVIDSGTERGFGAFGVGAGMGGRLGGRKEWGSRM
ncbi:hypothetical protein P152DRAFT_40256 [Eremomyces bilateralis CBS 781.70]|uniref:Uncharacterized protein n=1 Tax=Eremomyces bilateralis CBS 781.70 TaxID=1392243 RepID=A0A6G1G1U5_9PEZI|nr:uncharacterized protein P152DRAFT_40256 [Eremomyces bilateralis CBS 781.70]KAF1811988.1 hypothetical protein P152DRAFT_40256 [Eremomyces bilateralis CBS 781.70]